MNYKFNYSIIDDRKYSNLDNSRDFYKSPCIKRINQNTLDHSRDLIKSINFSSSKPFHDVRRTNNHRYNNSQESSGKILKKKAVNDQNFSENIRNTIEKYDFKMNFDLLKYKINKLNQLKEKEPFYLVKKIHESPLIKKSINYDTQEDNNKLNPKIMSNFNLNNTKILSTCMSSRKFTDEPTLTKQISKHERSEREIKTIESASSKSDFDIDEITEDLLKIKDDINRESEQNNKVLRKLLFCDDELEEKGEKKEVVSKVINNIPEKPDYEIPLNIKELVNQRVEEKVEKVKPDSKDDKNEELLKSQRLIRELSNTEFITLYERDIKNSENKENSSVKIQLNISYLPEHVPKDENCIMEKPGKRLNFEDIKEENKEMINEQRDNNPIHFVENNKGKALEKKIISIKLEQNEKIEKDTDNSNVEDENSKPRSLEVHNEYNLPEENNQFNLADENIQSNMSEENNRSNLPEEDNQYNLPDENNRSNLPEEDNQSNLLEENNQSNLPEEDNQSNLLEENNSDSKRPFEKNQSNIQEDKNNSFIVEEVKREMNDSLLNKAIPESKCGQNSDCTEKQIINSNLMKTPEKKEKEDTEDDDLSELSQFLKEAGLLTATKNQMKENIENNQENILPINQMKPISLNYNVVISQSSNFEIPSRQTFTPISHGQDHIRCGTAEFPEKQANTNDNISVNDIGNNSYMTNGSRRKVTFSENKTVINYEIKRFGCICSPSSLSEKKKTNKKPKSILIKKPEERENDSTLEKLNNLINECEEYKCDLSHIGSEKGYYFKKLETKNSNAIKVQNNLNQKFIQKNKKLVHEIEEKLKKGEPFVIKRSPTPKKQKKKNSFCNKFKKNPIKFYSEAPKIEHLSYELELKKDSEIIKNYNRVTMSPINYLHRKCNSSNHFSYFSLRHNEERRELSIISDRSHVLKKIKIKKINLDRVHHH